MKLKHLTTTNLYNRNGKQIMYAVFIAGTTRKSDTTRQLILISHNDDKFAIQRETNGGRGVENAWLEANYDLVTKDIYDYSFVVGQVIATPLTAVDITALENGERPNVLIQKMSKQWATLDTTITTNSFNDVITDIKTIIETDVEQLSKYRVDRRTGKDVSEPKKFEPIIQVVRAEAPTQQNGERNMNALVIPKSDEISWYLPRSFNGVNEFDVFTHAIKNRKPILMEGHAGTGKTSSAIWNAYKRNLGVSVLSCSAGLQVSDLVGKTIIMPDGEPAWIDGELVRAMRYGGGIVLDEINFAQPKVLHRVQDVVQNYKITLNENNGETIYAHPDFFIVATYNNGYRHTNALNEAVLDRYKIKLQFDYDYSIESKVVKLPTLLDLAKQMRNDAISGIYSTPVSLRMLKSFQELALDLNYDFAVNNFLMSFNADERPSVKLLMEAHQLQLQDEIDNLKKVGVK